MSENTQKNPAYKGKNAWKVYGDSNRLDDDPIPYSEFKE